MGEGGSESEGGLASPEKRERVGLERSSPPSADGLARTRAFARASGLTLSLPFAPGTPHPTFTFAPRTPRTFVAVASGRALFSTSPVPRRGIASPRQLASAPLFRLFHALLTTLPPRLSFPSTSRAPCAPPPSHAVLPFASTPPRLASLLPHRLPSVSLVLLSASRALPPFPLFPSFGRFPPSGASRNVSAGKQSNTQREGEESAGRERERGRSGARGSGGERRAEGRRWEAHACPPLPPELVIG